MLICGELRGNECCCVSSSSVVWRLRMLLLLAVRLPLVCPSAVRISSGMSGLTLMTLMRSLSEFLVGRG